MIPYLANGRAARCGIMCASLRLQSPPLATRQRGIFFCFARRCHQRRGDTRGETSMTIALFILAWLALGAVGSFLTLWFWWRDVLDLDVSTVLLGAVMSTFGPFNLLVGCVLFSSWALKRMLPNGFFDRVVAERRQ